ncbi:hypothetical protein BD779DRAFT_1207393 [Infundibulicybe gibba]|nr:hypothetical protein BD779DRAFT_1207393 [Infundibulicybe gibba]
MFTQCCNASIRFLIRTTMEPLTVEEVRCPRATPRPALHHGDCTTRKRLRSHSWVSAPTRFIGFPNRWISTQLCIHKEGTLTILSKCSIFLSINECSIWLQSMLERVPGMHSEGWQACEWGLHRTNKEAVFNTFSARHGRPRRAPSLSIR